MTLSDKLALQLRLALAYKNINNQKLKEYSGISTNAINRFCDGFIGDDIDNYETCLKALGFELDIKLKRKEGDTNAN